MFTDSHAHLTSDSVFENIEEILQRAQGAHVSTIFNICTNITTLERGLTLTQKYPWIYNIAATHPHDVAEEGERAFSSIEKYARQGDLIAIGETGLDYFYRHSPPEVQKFYLRCYFHLALSCNLPVVIHCREAFADFFEILDSDYTINGQHAPGVLHCFTGTEAEAEKVLSRGWYISLSGIVTFKKSEALRAIAKIIPINKLLIETDTPYLAPQNHRGKINEPSFLPQIAATIAETTGLSLEEIAQATSTNAKNLFKIGCKNFFNYIG